MKIILRSLMAVTLMITLTTGLSGCCCFKKAPLYDESGKVTSQDAALCTKCGQAKWTAVCCKADAVLCVLCGMGQGAPGCCTSSEPK